MLRSTLVPNILCWNRIKNIKIANKKQTKVIIKSHNYKTFLKRVFHFICLPLKFNKMCFGSWVCVDVPWSLSESSHQFLLIAQTFSSPNGKLLEWKFPCIHASVSALSFKPQMKISTSRTTSLLINYIQHFSWAQKINFLSSFSTRECKKFRAQ